jgi:hypothetical protein
MSTVELLCSKYDGKTLAVCVGGIRHGPNLGPWDVVALWPLDARLVAAARLDAARKLLAHIKANWTVKASGDYIGNIDRASIEFPGTEDDAELARIVGDG